MSKKATDLLVVDQLEASVLTTTKDLEKGLQEIKKKTNKIVPILDTKKGRIEFAGLAHSISKTKVETLKPLKVLLKGVKGIIQPLNDLNSEYELKFNEYRIEFRKPLTDWEADDDLKKKENEKRIEGIKNQIEAIKEYEPRDQHTNVPVPASGARSTELGKAIKFLEDYTFDEGSGFQEFLEEAVEARNFRVEGLRNLFEFKEGQEKLAAGQKKLDDDKKELKRQKKEQKDEKNRLEKIRTDGLKGKLKEIKDCEFTCVWKYASTVKKWIEKLKGITVDKTFQEFEGEAQKEKDRILLLLKKGLPLAEKADKEADDRKLKRESQSTQENSHPPRETYKVIGREQGKENDKVTLDREHKRKINRSIIGMFQKHGFTEAQSIKIIKVTLHEKNPNIKINY